MQAILTGFYYAGLHWIARQVQTGADQLPCKAPQALLYDRQLMDSLHNRGVRRVQQATADRKKKCPRSDAM